MSDDIWLAIPDATWRDAVAEAGAAPASAEALTTAVAMHRGYLTLGELYQFVHQALPFASKDIVLARLSTTSAASRPGAGIMPAFEVVAVLKCSDIRDAAKAIELPPRAADRSQAGTIGVARPGGHEGLPRYGIHRVPLADALAEAARHGVSGQLVVGMEGQDLTLLIGIPEPAPPEAPSVDVLDWQQLGEGSVELDERSGAERRDYAMRTKLEVERFYLRLSAGDKSAYVALEPAMLSIVIEHPFLGPDDDPWSLRAPALVPLRAFFDALDSLT